MQKVVFASLSEDGSDRSLLDRAKFSTKANVVFGTITMKTYQREVVTYLHTFFCLVLLMRNQPN